MKKLSVCLLTAVLSCWCATAFGWGKIGHDAIAYIAECNLTPKAKKNIEKYLGSRSIVYYASWMDQVRHTPAYRHTNTWHTNKVDAGGNYVPDPEGDAMTFLDDCIAKVEDYRNQNDSTVTVSIRFIVHLVGDMHCPTHVYYYPDNMTLGKFPVKLHGVETNYHKIWDGQLLDSRHKFWGFQDYRHALDNYTDEEIARMTEGTPVEWFEESARRCREIYDWVQPGDELGQEFYNAHAPFAEYQLVLSGYRLAKVLNALFDR